jgi:ABC-type phosphate/phosphonate transport system permease subunit
MRIMREATRELRAVLRGTTRTHERLRARIAFVTVVSLVLALVCAGLALWFENGAPQSEISNYGDALFWTSTQLLTVSSQLHNPVTTAGRVLDVLMEAYAISVVATLAGSFGAFFHARGRERDAEADRKKSAGSG